MMKNKLTVKEAAALMEVSEQFIRVGLQQGVLPFGYAVKRSSHWSYYISPVKFTEYTGIAVEDEEVEQVG